MAESKSSSGGGIGLGSVIACLLSYFKWHSFWWMIFHGICGWLYVLYFAFKFGLDKI